MNPVSPVLGCLAHDNSVDGTWASSFVSHNGNFHLTLCNYLGNWQMHIVEVHLKFRMGRPR